MYAGNSTVNKAMQKKFEIYNRPASFLPSPEKWKCSHNLPYGWEIAVHPCSRIYYVNHLARKLTWFDPREITRDQKKLRFIASRVKRVPARGDNGRNDGRMLFNHVRNHRANTPQKQKRAPQAPSAPCVSGESDGSREENAVKVRFRDQVAIMDDHQGKVDEPEVNKSLGAVEVFLADGGKSQVYRYYKETSVSGILTDLCQKLRLNDEFFSLVMVKSKLNTRTMGEKRDDIIIAPWDDIAQTVADPTFENHKCQLRMTFVPKDIHRLSRDHPNSFRYLYKQSVNDLLVDGMCVDELTSEQIVQLRATTLVERFLVTSQPNNNIDKHRKIDSRKVLVKLIEKGCDDVTFLPHHLMAQLATKNRQTRNMGKAIQHRVKVIHDQLVDVSRDDKLTRLRRDYIKILSPCHQFGGRYFDVVIQAREESRVKLVVGRHYGISQMINHVTRMSSVFADFDQLRSLDVAVEQSASVVKHTNVRIDMGNSTPLVVATDDRQATNLALTVFGYCRLHRNDHMMLILPFNKHLPDPPAYDDLHYVLPSDWNRPPSQCSDGGDGSEIFLCKFSDQVDRSLLTSDPIPVAMRSAHQTRLDVIDDVVPVFRDDAGSRDDTRRSRLYSEEVPVVVNARSKRHAPSTPPMPCDDVTLPQVRPQATFSSFKPDAAKPDKVAPPSPPIETLPSPPSSPSPPTPSPTPSLSPHSPLTPPPTPSPSIDSHLSSPRTPDLSLLSVHNEAPPATRNRWSFFGGGRSRSTADVRSKSRSMKSLSSVVEEKDAEVISTSKRSWLSSLFSRDKKKRKSRKGIISRMFRKRHQSADITTFPTTSEEGGGTYYATTLPPRLDLPYVSKEVVVRGGRERSSGTSQRPVSFSTFHQITPPSPPSEREVAWPPARQPSDPPTPLPRGLRPPVPGRSGSSDDEDEVLDRNSAKDNSPADVNALAQGKVDRDSNLESSEWNTENCISEVENVKLEVESSIESSPRVESVAKQTEEEETDVLKDEASEDGSTKEKAYVEDDVSDQLSDAEPSLRNDQPDSSQDNQRIPDSDLSLPDTTSLLSEPEPSGNNGFDDSKPHLSDDDGSLHDDPNLCHVTSSSLTLLNDAAPSSSDGDDQSSLEQDPTLNEDAATPDVNEHRLSADTTPSVMDGTSDDDGEASFIEVTVTSDKTTAEDALLSPEDVQPPHAAGPEADTDSHLDEGRLDLDEEKLLTNEEKPFSVEPHAYGNEDLSVHGEEPSLNPEESIVNEVEELFSTQEKPISNEKTPVVSEDNPSQDEGKSLRNKENLLLNEDKPLLNEGKQLIHEDKPLLNEDKQLIPEDSTLIREDKSLLNEDKPSISEDKSLLDEDKPSQQEQPVNEDKQSRNMENRFSTEIRSNLNDHEAHSSIDESCAVKTAKVRRDENKNRTTVESEVRTETNKHEELSPGGARSVSDELMFAVRKRSQSSPLTANIKPLRAATPRAYHVKPPLPPRPSWKETISRVADDVATTENGDAEKLSEDAKQHGYLGLVTPRLFGFKADAPRRYVSVKAPTSSR